MDTEIHKAFCKSDTHATTMYLHPVVTSQVLLLSECIL